MIRDKQWLIGTVLYFSSIGLWFILLLFLFFWSIPVVVLVYLLGVVSANFTKKIEAWPAFRSFWLWEWIRENYFEYNTTHNYSGPSYKGKVIWAIYPHGTLPITTLFYWALNPKQFPDTITCIHSAIFSIPFLRDMAYWINCTSVKKEDIIKALRFSNSIAINPGGIEDISYTDNKTVAKRYGFLKIALAEKAKVIPVWVPLERSLFSVWMPLGRTLEPYLRYPFPLFIWPILPRKMKMRICVGNPIDCSKEDMGLEDAYEQFYKEIERLQAIERL